jgi:predicted nucleotidyltransferase
MAKIPDQPQDIFVPLMQDYLQAFGSDLLSLMLFGSAAGGGYVKGKSDINVLVVLTPEGMNRLDNALPLVKSWKKRNVAVPLVMTKAFMESSLDSYPIEFLNMKNNSVLIYGENVLSQLAFEPQDLRLQIEREMKSKILLLREGYLESEGQARPIRNLIGKSLTAFVSIFNALLYLKTGAAPHDKHKTISEMNKIFGIHTDVFAMCFDIKQGADKLSSEEVISVFKKYLSEAEKVCHHVDGL